MTYKAQQFALSHPQVLVLCVCDEDVLLTPRIWTYRDVRLVPPTCFGHNNNLHRKDMMSLMEMQVFLF